MNFEKMSQEICAAVGGVENIVNVAHCATRFRIVLVDDKKIDKDAIEKIDGVSGIIKVGSQWQIIVGKEVAELYQVFTGKYHIETGKKKQFDIKNIIADIGTYLQAAIGPMLVPMIGMAIIKAVLTLLSTSGIVDATNATYAFLWGCADISMYYMPVLLAYGAAKKLNCNPILAMALALMMVNPTYVAAVASGAEQTLFGFTVTPYTYSQQFLPILVAVPIFAVIEKFLKKHTPELLSMIVVPAGSLFIMIPIIFLIIGPAMTAFSNFLVGPATLIMENRYIVFPVMAMMWSLLGTLGVHGAIYNTIYLFYFSTLGFDPICLPSYLCTHISIGTVALMSAFLTKDIEKKQIGLTTGITMLFAGISEPAIFGVLIRDKRFFAAQLAAAFVAGIYGGIAGIGNYVAGAWATLLYLPAFVGEGSAFIEVLIMVAICMAASILFSLLFTGFIGKKKSA